MPKNQLKYGAVLTYVTLLVGNVVALLYTPFLLRSLGKSEYGLYNLAFSIVGYLTVLDFGFGSATVKYTAKFRAEGKEDKAYSMCGMFIALYAIIGIITFCIGLLIAVNAEQFFAQGLSVEEIKIVKKLLILASINLTVSFPFGVFTSIITAYEKFIFLKVSSLLRQLINPLVFIPVLFFGYKSIGLIIATTILNFLFLLANLLYCFIKLKIKISFKEFNFTLLKEIFSYSIWIFVGSIVGKLWWNSGQFILGVYVSSASIAIYSLAIQFVGYFESFATAISGVFLPRMTAMVSNKASDEEFSDYFIKVGRLQFIVIALITTGFFLFGRQFILFWAGEEYLKTYLVTMLIFIPLSIVDIQTLGITILQAKNKHKFRALIYLLIAILCVGISIPLIQLWAELGCTIATVSALTIGNIFIMNWYYSKQIGINIKKFWKNIARMFLPIAGLTCCTYLVLQIIPIQPKLSILLVEIFVYSFVYMIIVYFCSANEYERKLLNTLLKKLMRK